MNKAEKEFCKTCDLHKLCGFVGRGLEHKCSSLSDFSLGYERAVDKALQWLEKNWNFYDYPSSLMFNDFRKAMQDG